MTMAKSIRGKLMRKRLLLSVVSAVLLSLGSITSAFAQGANGLLDGKIVDASGNGVAGVMVTVTSDRTGLTRSTSTNSSGNFKIQLPPGAYQLASEKAGYSNVTIEVVNVNLGTSTNMTIPLQDAAIEEAVTYGSAESLISEITSSK